MGLGIPQLLGPTLIPYILYNMMVVCLLMSRNLFVTHPQQRLWKFYVEIGVYKVFTSKLQKLVFYQIFFQIKSGFNLTFQK